MLNFLQKKAVEADTGPIRIIAGAGTGKTMTLIHRIVNLIEKKGVRPHCILALTFTNKAAHEMAKRLHAQNLSGVFAMTFHSLAARFLREYWRPDFKIITGKEKEEILKDILMQGEDLKEVILELDHLRYDPEDRHDPRIQEIFAAYEQELADQNVFDFTGLLTNLLKIWNEKPDILAACQKKFDYILVDECQDVNRLQIEIMRRLAAPHKNLCVVGDPDQTIYSWRGAKADTMDELTKLYPDISSVTLYQNYRNPPAILKGAERLISHNSDRSKKQLEAVKSGGQAIKLWESDSEWQSYDKLFHILETHLGSHSDMHMADILDAGRDEDCKKLSDIAILYRTQAEGKKLAAQLADKGYPFQMSAPESFWESKEIVEFLEEVTMLSGIDFDTEEKFSEWLNKIIDNFIKAKNPSYKKANQLSHLVSYAMAFDDLCCKEALIRFLDEARLEQEADNIIASDRINLLTLHAAKGLEFPVVLIYGLEEGHIPHSKLANDLYFLSEERRLLYVGMTRATEELHLFYTKKIKEKDLKPSRFLDEIGRVNLVSGELPKKEAVRIKRKEIKKAQMKLF